MGEGIVVHRLIRQLPPGMKWVEPVPPQTQGAVGINELEERRITRPLAAKHADLVAEFVKSADNFDFSAASIE